MGSAQFGRRRTDSREEEKGDVILCDGTDEPAGRAMDRKLRRLKSVWI